MSVESPAPAPALIPGPAAGSDDPFELIFESAAVGMFVTDADRKFVRVNPAFCRLSGYDADDLLGREFMVVLPEEHRGLAATLHDGVMAGGAGCDGEWSLLRKDGRLLRVLAAAGKLTALDGRRYKVTTVVDITAKTEAEAALRMSEERFRALVQYSSDAILVIDAAGAVREVSDSVTRLFGYRSGELTGRPVLDLVHPDDLGTVSDLLTRNLASPLPPHRVAARVRHADGRWVTIEAHVQNLLAHPAVRGLVANVRDVTEERRLAEQFRQAQKMEALGQLAGGVAHDFNNLLTVILGNLDLVALPAGDPNRRRLDAVAQAVGRGASLTNALLGFARRQPLRFAPVDLAGMLTDTTALLRRTFDPRVAIATELAPDCPPVLGDAGAVQQAVVNLCLNARDAMPAGGRLTLSAGPTVVADPPHHPDARPGAFVRLSVADTGTGIAPEHLDRVFEPFFTTKPAGEGTGLGLAMVYGTARQHGGWVEVVTRYGVGTRFDVFLPPATAAAPTVDRAPPAPAAVRTGTVLIVDDEAMVLTVARTMLEQAGYRVRTAGTAAEAMAAVRYDPAIDVVVLDLTMPDRSGLDTFADLRAAIPGARIVIASGSAPEAGPLVGAAGFLPKPFTRAALLDAVGRAGRPPGSTVGRE